MGNENVAARTLRSATDETADAVKSAARDTAGMATEKAARTLRSATDETAKAVKSAARDTAGATADAARETADRSTETVKKLTEQSSREFGRLVDSSAQASQAAANIARETADRSTETVKKLTERTSREFGQLLDSSAQTSQDAARHFSRNFDVLFSVGTVVASSYQSFFSEWSKYAQQATKRNAEALNEVFKVRTARDLLNVQGSYLKESVQGLLSASARVSELSARTATEAVDKLNARS